jgi:predicted DNA-binding transcriptional regulator AlpA
MENRTKPHQLISRREAAEQLGVSVQTLANWSAQGKGPRVVRLGRTVVRYDPIDIAAFIDDAKSGRAPSVRTPAEERRFREIEAAGI